MRNRIVALCSLLLVSVSIFAQFEQPVSWSFEHKKIDDNKYELSFTSEIDSPWHMYGTNLLGEGPVPTSINYNDTTILINKSEIKVSPLPEKHFDPAFGVDILYWEGGATITQVVEVDPNASEISGYVEFMVCDDERCLPPDVYDFKIVINNKGGSANVASDNSTASDEAGDTSEAEGRSYWGIFFLSFAGGLVALLTPCVFPMIPMTVSFFTKQSKNKRAGIVNAIRFGFFIIVIYVLLGSLVVGLFGADALNALSTNPWFNFFFFLLLVVFAISFLGAFEIVLPSKWVNKADSKADKGGIVGAFFMALVLALVSFSCTGPVVGTLLVTAATEGGIAPVIGMFGFSLALALPFALLAMFPGYLNSLPKSGGWLNSVKVVLGLLELAFAFKFLSNVDLVLDLKFLEREVFIAIWIAIFGTLSVYLFGKLQLKHDSPVEKLSASRLVLALVTLSFTIYMIPGLWGAPLKLISAFPPPLEYSESPQGVGYNSPVVVSASSGATQQSGGGELAELERKRELGPQGISVFHDYDDALEYARAVNKPLFIDFTGKACQNCRKMEINVWGDPEVNRLMKDEYVVVALYVDLRTKLPEAEQYVSEISGKKIRTIGNKWSDFQLSRYKINSQPYYVLLDHDENELIKPKAYEPSIEAYKEWLEKGLEKFNEK